MAIAETQPNPKTGRPANWRMALDIERCIGCHACSVACKVENKVPLGRFRTKVYYLDEGKFPKVKRHFLPTLCMQCEDTPCLKACDRIAIVKGADGMCGLTPTAANMWELVRPPAPTVPSAAMKTMLPINAISARTGSTPAWSPPVLKPAPEMSFTSVMPTIPRRRIHCSLLPRAASSKPSNPKRKQNRV